LTSSLDILAFVDVCRFVYEHPHQISAAQSNLSDCTMLQRRPQQDPDQRIMIRQRTCFDAPRWHANAAAACLVISIAAATLPKSEWESSHQEELQSRLHSCACSVRRAFDLPAYSVCHDKQAFQLASCKYKKYSEQHI